MTEAELVRQIEDMGGEDVWIISRDNGDGSFGFGISFLRRGKTRRFAVQHTEGGRELCYSWVLGAAGEMLRATKA